MATITGRSSSASTTNTTSYASTAFTPAVGDLLVFMLVASGTASAGSITSSAGYTFTKVQEATLSTTNKLYVFVANSLVTAAVSQTLTFTCTDDAATGCFRVVASISGMSRAGASAVRQSAARNSGTSGTTPAVALGAAALTGNPLIALLSNLSSPANIVHPSGWSEQNDSGYSTPTTGFQYANINSGFTGSTVTWGSTSGTNYCALAVEFDTSAVVAQTLTPSLFTNANSFSSPSVSVGLSPSQFANTQTFYAHSAAVGPASLVPTRFDNTSNLFAPTVARGAVALSPSRLDNSQGFFSALVASAPVSLSPPLYGNLQTFYGPSVAAGGVSISASRLENAQSFFAASLSTGGPSVTLTPPRTENTSVLFTPSVGVGAVTIAPAQLTNTQTFYSPHSITLSLRQATPFSNQQSFFAQSVQAGAVTLTQASKLENAQLFYGPFVGEMTPPDLGRNIAGGMIANMGTWMSR